MEPGIIEAVIAAAGVVVAALLTLVGVLVRVLFGMRGEVTQINAAVNHQDPTEPRLVERVCDIQDEVTSTRFEQRELRRDVGAVAVTVANMHNRVGRIDTRTGALEHRMDQRDKIDQLARGGRIDRRQEGDS